MATTGRREFLISKGWLQAVALVVLFGFFVLGLLAYRTYQAQPPIPERVLDGQGNVLFTGKDVSQGQQVFLNNGLMEYGSVFGHGAYLGPDYTADYLRRSSDLVRDSYGGASSDAAVQKTIEDLRTNRYDRRRRRSPSVPRRQPPSGSSFPTTGLSSPTRRASTAFAPTRSPTLPSSSS